MSKKKKEPAKSEFQVRKELANAEIEGIFKKYNLAVRLEIMYTKVGIKPFLNVIDTNVKEETATEEAED